MLKGREWIVGIKVRARVDRAHLYNVLASMLSKPWLRSSFTSYTTRVLAQHAPNHEFHVPPRGCEGGLTLLLPGWLLPAHIYFFH